MTQHITQLQRVENHLKQNKSITSVEAFRLYGITRLSDIIFRLRKRGLIITSENVRKPNRFGDKCNFAKYRLMEGE